MSAASGPWFPEFDYTPEERLKAVAEILLRGMRRMLAEQKREKTRRWRERRAAAGTDGRLAGVREASPHADPEES